MTNEASTEAVISVAKLVQWLVPSFMGILSYLAVDLKTEVDELAQAIRVQESTSSAQQVSIDYINQQITEIRGNNNANGR